MIDAVNLRPTRPVFILFLGVLLGEMLFISPAFLFMVALMALIVYALTRTFKEPGERRFIVSVFVAGLAIRLALCIAAYFYVEWKGSFYDFYSYKSNCIFGDSAFASINGLWIAQYWNGALKPSDTDYTFFSNLKSINPYFYAVFYSLFGFKELSAKFINVILGAAAPIFIYLTTKELFSKASARIAYLATMFFPSLMIWSIADLKEVKQIFFAAASFYLSLQIIKRPFSIIKIALFVACGTLLYYMHPQYGIVFIASMAAGACLNIPMPLRRKMLLLISVILLVMSFQYFWQAKDPIAGFLNKASNALGDMVYKQASKLLSVTSRTHYTIYSDRLYLHIISNIGMEWYKIDPIEPFVYLGRGITYFLFTPFPWDAVTGPSLLAVPQVLAWYLLFLFAIMGVKYTIVDKVYRAAALVIFLLLGTSLAAMVSANIGTVFRHRDLFTPFFLIFSAVGIERVFSKK